MKKLVECVPNFSEGRRKEVIEAIAAAGRRIKGARILDVEWDKSHNRSLVTIVGAPQPVFQAVWAMIKVATARIDMTKHKGEHPRIGATDVVPFIPISGVTMVDCVELAEKLAKKVAEELQIPVYLYEAAATCEERRNLAKVRQGEYEGLRQAIKTDPKRKPDFGPRRLHKTAGAMVIGARKFLLAYNVNLDTKDVQVAKDVAKAIRESSGGLVAVKALGFAVEGGAQVSMNLVDFEITNLDEAYRAVAAEAKKRGIKIKNSEVYGLIPLEALIRMVRTGLRAEDFKREQVLEVNLWE
jgi:glutamate formiminotransferase